MFHRWPHRAHSQSASALRSSAAVVASTVWHNGQTVGELTRDGCGDMGYATHSTNDGGVSLRTTMTRVTRSSRKSDAAPERAASSVA